MKDDPRLQVLGQFTPEGQLMPGFGDHYIFLVGRDDCHAIMHYLLTHETLEHDFNQYGYAIDRGYCSPVNTFFGTDTRKRVA